MSYSINLSNEAYQQYEAWQVFLERSKINGNSTRLEAFAKLMRGSAKNDEEFTDYVCNNKYLSTAVDQLPNVARGLHMKAFNKLFLIYRLR